MVTSGTNQRILDLACGDGHLYLYLKEALGKSFSYIGIDMSEGELSVAHKNLAEETNVILKNERAQNTSMADSEMDCVLSHMAFMLMNPVNEVVNEISRILKPGGKFCAVVGARGRGIGLCNEIHQFMGKLLHSRINNLNKMISGDSRTSTVDGLNELFTSSAWKSVKIDDCIFSLSCKPQDVWAYFEDMYFIDLLTKENLADLKKGVTEITESKAENGLVLVEHNLSIIECERA